MRGFAGRALSFIVGEKLLVALSVLFLALLIGCPGFASSLPGFFDTGSLSLILLYMAASRALFLSGVSENVALWLVGSMRRVGVAGLVVFVYLLSAVITNDGAVLVFAPIALSLSRITGRDRAWLIPVVLLAANMGSALTPFGNPQNIIVWQAMRLGTRVFMGVSAPLSMLGLALLLIHGYAFGERSRGKALGPRPPRVRVKWGLGASGVAAIVLGAVLGELHMGLYALILGVVVIGASDWRALRTIDPGIAASFVLMFPVFNGIAWLASPFMPQRLAGMHLYFTGLVLSQATSNVPATILLSKLTRDWKTLVIAANTAGVATPLGSMANIIGMKITGLSTKEYLRTTLPYTAALVATAAMLVVAIG